MPNKFEFELGLTLLGSTWLLNLKMFEICSAAKIHLLLLSVAMGPGILFFSALKMAAWWRQMVAVWMAMLQKMTLGSVVPTDNRR